MMEKVLSGFFAGIFMWCMRNTIGEAWAEYCNYRSVKTRVEQERAKKAKEAAGNKNNLKES